MFARIEYMDSGYVEKKVDYLTDGGNIRVSVGNYASKNISCFCEKTSEYLQSTREYSQAELADINKVR